MCKLSWTPHSNLEKDNSLKTTPVLAQRWAVWSILTMNYSSPVPEICPQNLMTISQFNSDHRVNFNAPTCCLSATFVPPLFAFVVCFYGKKIIINFATFCDILLCSFRVNR